MPLPQRPLPPLMLAWTIWGLGAALYFIGLSLNVLTMMGLLLGVGMHASWKRATFENVKTTLYVVAGAALALADFHIDQVGAAVVVERTQFVEVGIFAAHIINRNKI